MKMEKCDAGIDEMDDLRKQVVDFIRRVEHNSSMSIALKNKVENISLEFNVNLREMRQQMMTLHAPTNAPDSPICTSHEGTGNLTLDFKIDDDGETYTSLYMNHLRTTRLTLA